MTDSARLTFLFACAGHAAFHVLVALFLTLVLVIEPIWRLPYDDLIALWTWGALMLGAGAPAAGWLGDRFGESRVMIVYFLGIGVATIMCGLAEGPAQLWPALTAMGLFGAIYHPVGTAWVMKNVTRRGRSIATLGIAGSIGAAFASLVAGGLADLFDWRLAFIVPGALAVAIGLALLVAYITGRVRDRHDDASPQPDPSKSDIRRALFALLTTTTALGIAYYAVTTMLPKWIELEVGADLGDGLIGIGVLATTIYLLGASAQFVGGHFADQGLGKQVYIISFLAKMVALLAATTVGGWAIVPMAIVVVFVFDVAAPVENVLIARYTPSRRRGLAYGIRNGLATVAAPLGVQLVAWLFEPGVGFTNLFYALAALALAMGVVAFALPNERRVAVAG
ncbi:MAG: MFS transporter [Alphaproteobacteria bacterium]